MPAIKPNSALGHTAQRKSSNPKMDLVCLSRGNTGDGPVAAMQHVKIVSAAFLGSALGKPRRPQSTGALNQKVNDFGKQREKEVFHNTRALVDVYKSNHRDLHLSDEESSDTESSVEESAKDFTDSSTEDDFQTESDVGGTAEKENENYKDTQKKMEKGNCNVHRPGASGDASVRHESVSQRDAVQRKPPPFGDPTRIQEVLKTLQSTLKMEDTSATRPTTPTVCVPNHRNQGRKEPEEHHESRGSGDTFVGNRGYSSWAAWSYAKEKKMKEEMRREAERKKRAEMEERDLQERRQKEKRAALLEWMQRKQVEREVLMKAQAAQLEELRRKEEEKREAAKEASLRARRKWCLQKDQQLRERRLQEEKLKAETREKEQRRKELAEKCVKEWRRLRASPCALNASTYVNPQPWVNIVEPYDEDKEKPPKQRPRRTRREQDRICARLSRPLAPRTACSMDSENVCKRKLSWVQSVKKRSEATSKRCVSRPSTQENNPDIILSRSDFKSPASRTSEWIKSVISRRFGQENIRGINPRENTVIVEKSRTKSPAKDKSKKSQAVNGHPTAHAYKYLPHTRPKPKSGKRMETR